MNFRRFIFAALAALIAASPAFAAVPRYVEGEAIVMLRNAAPLAAANSLSADGVPAIAKNSAAPDLGAVVVQSFRPVKAAPQDGAEAEAAGGAPRMRAANGLSSNDEETYPVAHLRSASGESTEDFIERLRDNPNVVSAMPNYIMTLSDNSGTDENSDVEAWRPNDQAYEAQWGMEKIGMPQVWKKVREAESSEEVVVAVIDTGIIYDHEDLKDNMFTFDAGTLNNIGSIDGVNAQKFVGSHGVWFHSDCSNLEEGSTMEEMEAAAVTLQPVPIGSDGGTTTDAGIDDALDNTENSRYVGDVDGHGTHVAGIIGAATNNEKGIAGIAQNVKLMAVGVFSVLEDGGEEDDEDEDEAVGGGENKSEEGYTGEPTVSYSNGALTSDQIRAIDFIIAAKEAGVNIRVANMSLGNWSDDTMLGPENLYSRKIKEMSDAGIIVCIAAGNEQQNLDAPKGKYEGQICTPTMFRYENTIAVGASDENDEWSSAADSNYSSSGKWVDIFAPGENILSTCRFSPITDEEDNSWNKYGYTGLDGTSMASPHVAGVAALLCSAFPDRSATEIKQAILDSANSSVLREGYSQYGRLDAYAAWKLCAARSSGGGGGGCSAGGGALALLGLPFVYGLMRKFRKKGD